MKTIIHLTSAKMLIIISAFASLSQTVPSEQPLIFTQDFSGLSHSSTTYTTGY
jgi:hypothetical protein